MTGGLLQLVAYGAQDVYLTGNPQITFFKVVYRRHTNFAMEAIQQTFNGTAKLDNRVTAQISRNGDLIHKMYVEMDINVTIKNNITVGTDGTADGVAATDVNIDTGDNEHSLTYLKNIGQWILKKVELEIGGQLIDRQYSEWMYIWNELSLPSGKTTGFNDMVSPNNLTVADNIATPNITKKYVRKLYVPLEFWFCRNIGLALPLIALQYHEVKINIEFGTIDIQTYTKTNAATANIIADGTLNTGTTDGIDEITVTTTIGDANLWVDYIFLDTDERRRFAQLSHEYLIEQVQFTGQEIAGTKTKLNFNHPVKALYWINRLSSGANSTDWTTFNNNANSKTKLQLNGNDRFAERDNKYFTHIQPYQHHTNIPVGKNINMYSFGLKPEEHQPSGTLNMSRIDTATLAITDPAGSSDTYVYALSYNVLRILSGMAGLAYSN